MADRHKTPASNPKGKSKTKTPIIFMSISPYLFQKFSLNNINFYCFDEEKPTTVTKNVSDSGGKN